MIEGVNLISNYDPNVSDERQIVEITLMQWEYVGHIYMSIGGNCKGLDILTCADFESETFENNPKDFELRYDEDADYFTAILKSPDGDTLETEGEGIEMNNMIVGLRIVDKIPEL